MMKKKVFTEAEEEAMKAFNERYEKTQAFMEEAEIKRLRQKPPYRTGGFIQHLHETKLNNYKFYKGKTWTK